MRLWRIPLRHEGALGIGRLVVYFSFRCKECKLCSRWHWLRYSWNDQWSWWIAWVLIFSRRYVLLRVRAHLNVPCWSLLCNALLSKKTLSSFCEVCSVDGRSISWARWWPRLSKKAYISSDENKEWNSRHMMDVNLNHSTTNNLRICWFVVHRWCTSRCLR